MTSPLCTNTPSCIGERNQESQPKAAPALGASNSSKKITGSDTSDNLHTRARAEVRSLESMNCVRFNSVNGNFTFNLSLTSAEIFCAPSTSSFLASSTISLTAKDFPLPGGPNTASDRG